MCSRLAEQHPVSLGEKGIWPFRVTQYFCFPATVSTVGEEMKRGFILVSPSITRIEDLPGKYDKMKEGQGSQTLGKGAVRMIPHRMQSGKA